MPTPLLPPPAQVLADDLVHLSHMLPPTALTLVRVAGVDAALALLRTWPGIRFPCPKHPSANDAGARRWQQLADVVGEAAMGPITAHYGGSDLEIPLCVALLAEKRNRWIRARFDDLVSPRLACLPGTAAVTELGLALAEAGQALDWRQIMRILDAADTQPGDQLVDDRQADLFTPLEDAL